MIMHRSITIQCLVAMSLLSVACLSPDDRIFARILGPDSDNVCVYSAKNKDVWRELACLPADDLMRLAEDAGHAPAPETGWVGVADFLVAHRSQIDALAADKDRIFRQYASRLTECAGARTHPIGLTSSLLPGHWLLYFSIGEQVDPGLVARSYSLCFFDLRSGSLRRLVDLSNPWIESRPPKVIVSERRDQAGRVHLWQMTSVDGVWKAVNIGSAASFEAIGELNDHQTVFFRDKTLVVYDSRLGRFHVLGKVPNGYEPLHRRRGIFPAVEGSLFDQVASSARLETIFIPVRSADGLASRLIMFSRGVGCTGFCTVSEKLWAGHLMEMAVGRNPVVIPDSEFADVSSLMPSVSSTGMER